MVQYIRPPCRTWTMKLCFFRDLPMLFPWSLAISSHQMCPPQAHPLSSRLRLRKVISHERQLGQVILPFGENHLSMDINGVDFTFPDWIAGRYHCMKPGKPAVEPSKTASPVVILFCDNSTVVLRTPWTESAESAVSRNGKALMGLGAFEKHLHLSFRINHMLPILGLKNS